MKICKILAGKIAVFQNLYIDFFEEDKLMCAERTAPAYEIVPAEEGFGIFGKDGKTGETVLIKSAFYDRKTAEKAAALLNGNSVSLLSAREVIRDFLIAPLYE